MANPDYIFDPDDWEYTHAYEDRSDMIEDIELGPGEYKRFGTLVKGPDRYAAKVVLSRDAEGDADQTEVRWFDSLEEVHAACGRPERSLI